MVRKNRISTESLQNGQIWELKDANLQIDLVGKTLVHYKHYKGKTKRAPISLATKEALQKYLKANHAILVQE